MTTKVRLDAAGRERETLASVAYEKLRHEIITVALSPGEKLRIRPLCDRYDMGLSPIREALNRVARDGLVEQLDLRGFRVAPVSERDLEELTKARCWVNEIAVRASIAQGDSAWEESVLVAYHRLSRVPRFVADTATIINPDWEIAHRAFHASLIAACGSRWIVDFCEQLFDAANRYRYLSRTTSFRTRAPRPDEHRAIMEAAVARNADKTVGLLSRHFRRTAELGQRELLRIAAQQKPLQSARRRQPNTP